MEILLILFIIIITVFVGYFIYAFIKSIAERKREKYEDYVMEKNSQRRRLEESKTLAKRFHINENETIIRIAKEYYETENINPKTYEPYSEHYLQALNNGYPDEWLELMDDEEIKNLSQKG